MKNKKGFTLMELLIAGTIVGILSLVATVSYQHSVADTRIANAKPKVDQIVNAIQRYEYDHGGTIQSGQLADQFSSNVSCSSETKDYRVLMGCNLLSTSGWDDSYVFYYVCGKSTGGPCAGASITNPWACMKVKGSKWPKKYTSPKSFMYCATPTENGSTF